MTFQGHVYNFIWMIRCVTAYRGIINLINGFTSWWDRVHPSKSYFYLERIFIDALEEYAKNKIAEIDATNPNGSSNTSS